MNRSLLALNCGTILAITAAGCGDGTRYSGGDSEPELFTPQRIDADLGHIFGDALDPRIEITEIEPVTDPLPLVPLSPGDVQGEDVVAAYGLPAEIRAQAVSMVETGVSTMAEALELGGASFGTIVRNGDELRWEDAPNDYLRLVDEGSGVSINFDVEIMNGELSEGIHSFLPDNHEVVLTAQNGEDVYRVTLLQNSQSRTMHIEGSIVRDGTTWYMNLYESGQFWIAEDGTFLHDLGFTGSIDGETMSIEVTEGWGISTFDKTTRLHRTINSEVTRGTDVVKFKQVEARTALNTETGRPMEYQVSPQSQTQIGWSAQGSVQRDHATLGNAVMEFTQSGGMIELYFDFDERFDLAWWRIAPIVPFDRGDLLPGPSVTVPTNPQ